MATVRPTAAGRYICATCRHQAQTIAHRSFTSATSLRVDPSVASEALQNAFRSTEPKTRTYQPQANAAPRAQGRAPSDVMNILNKRRQITPFSSDAPATNESEPASATQSTHRLYILATKHNTHITLTQPLKSAMLTVGSSISTTSASAAERKKMVDTLISLSTGNIGFRKSGRGSYDAAFQLAAFVMKQIQEKGMLAGIDKLEIILRGFGAGRQAVEKILTGTEGKLLRPRVVAVMDATRLKFGGNRSPKPRRLG